MNILGFVTGLVLIVLVLLDAFETVILPRRVTRRFRLTRAFYRITWGPWIWITSLATGKRRDMLLSFFGPLSLLGLLVVWAFGLILSFALLQWSLALPINIGNNPSFEIYLYMSGTTFFTLGFGDIVPMSDLGRMLAVLESGAGFGFLALVLGYLPVLYQAFSRREANISLLDARAGSPPTATELLRRESGDDELYGLSQLLHGWERSSAELMESHLSYPVLAYFRSQHDNQNWLAALTAILDTSAVALVVCKGHCQQQGRLTFAIARHAVVDLAQVFGVPPRRDATERLSAEQLTRLVRVLPKLSSTPIDCDRLREELSKLSGMYEPYVLALAEYLRLSLPPWAPLLEKSDNWQTSAWGQTSKVSLPAAGLEDEHS
jgi:Ion channel